MAEQTNNRDMSDEPARQDLEDRIDELEQTVAKMLPSRRDALKLGGAALVGGAAMSGSASAGGNEAGTIGTSGAPVDVESEDINNADTVTTQDLVVNGTATGVAQDLQGCRVRLGTTQSIPQNTKTKVEFDAKVYDSGNNFDTANHEWTCPADGLYIANLGVEFNGGGDAQQRRQFIGSGTDPNPTGKGAQMNIHDTDQNNRDVITTVNQYSKNETIAAYVRNKDSPDELRTLDNNSVSSYFEVAFLGSL